MGQLTDQLNKLRERLKLSKSEFAEKIGLDKRNVTWLLSEGRAFGAKTALRIERALGVPAEELMIYKIRDDLEEAKKEIGTDLDRLGKAP